MVDCIQIKISSGQIVTMEWQGSVRHISILLVWHSDFCLFTCLVYAHTTCNTPKIKESSRHMTSLNHLQHGCEQHFGSFSTWNFSRLHKYPKPISRDLDVWFLLFFHLFSFSPQDGTQSEGQSKTKQESAWLFRLWYTFDHKYPFSHSKQHTNTCGFVIKNSSTVEHYLTFSPLYSMLATEITCEERDIFSNALEKAYCRGLCKAHLREYKCKGRERKWWIILSLLGKVVLINDGVPLRP